MTAQASFDRQETRNMNDPYGLRAEATRIIASTFPATNAARMLRDAADKIDALETRNRELYAKLGEANISTL
jgi:hypothetical protein